MSDRILSVTECEGLWMVDPTAGRKALSRYAAAAERHASEALILSAAGFEPDAQIHEAAAGWARRAARNERDDPPPRTYA